MEYTSYKQKLKPAILEEAGKRFRQNGIKAVRMDDIAKGLAISKRTLYELYSTKENLLLDVLRNIQDMRSEHMEEFVAQSHNNTMDILIEVLRLQMEAAAHINADFFSDIESYPKASMLMRSFADSRRDASFEFFQKGIKEGYFLDSIDYAIMEKIIAESMKAIRTNKDFKMLSYKQLFISFLYVLLRGICTPKGVERIDAFVNKQFGSQSI